MSELERQDKIRRKIIYSLDAAKGRSAKLEALVDACGLMFDSGYKLPDTNEMQAFLFYGGKLKRARRVRH